ncbi:MAG: LysM peptidoglycan-binding domain-containing protein [Clostridiales Family XIII bacterium]|nr:LysM peptidoglycan-binding domain-containing protein [Clostridiales Family XIII bacterium]
MLIERAKITVLNDKMQAVESIDIQFNPSEFSIDRSARFSDDDESVLTDAAESPQFLSERRAVLKVKLTLDGFTSADALDEEKAEDVSKRVKKLRKLVTLDEKLHRPPLCLFEWGTTAFTGYTENMNVNYTMFSSGGIPIRATVDLTFKSVDKKQTALQSPDRTKRHVLTQGTPLYAVAYEAYNDPTEWRPIAEANGIKNPRKLRAGTVLKIPPLEFEPL